MGDPEAHMGIGLSHARAFWALIPAPLPSVPTVTIGNALPRPLSEADLALGRLDCSIQILPNSDGIVFMYVRKEAVLSSGRE
jgi:hypothetical protein